MKILWLVLIGLMAVSCIPEAPSPAVNNDGQNQDHDVGQDVDDDAGEEQLPDGWSWVDIAGTSCGNGAQTGLGLSEGTDSTRLMIYFNGGGACWDATSCHIFNSASHIDSGYGERRFTSDLNTMRNSGVIDREEGPFGQATFVFLPYCTGDFHSGDAVGQYNDLDPNQRVHHKGAVNVDAYLDYLTQEYPDVDEVLVLGISAGGYGAMMNHHRIKAAFPDAQVHVLADGSPMIQPRDGRWNMWKNAWNMRIPEGCEACEESYPEYAAHVVEASPESRFGLLTWHEDQTVGLFFSYQWGLEEATLQLLADVYPDEPGGQSSAFHTAGTDHVMLQYFETLRDDNGQSLRDFVQSWVDGAQ